MSFENVRDTVAFIKEESTEGTPVSPTAAGDAISLQDGFSLEPNFESVENAELTGSLASAAPIQGLESPSGSFSHYLRHSGTEGQAPNYFLLLKSLFGASETNGTERTTDAGSTTSVIALTAGGTDFSRGKAVLVKDGTNGYSVRNVLSVSTDDLTLAFNLSDAPASGIDVGKCINLYMASTGVPFSYWQYNANGGAIEMVSGFKSESATMNFPAADAINVDYSFVGQQYYFNPVEITSSNKYLDITDDGGTFVVTLTEGMYRDPAELATHIQTVGAAAAAASGGDDFLCSYSSSTGKFTISTTTGTTLSVLWKTGTHGSDNADDHVGTTIGFDDSADDTGATSYEADSAMDWSAPYTPSVDSEDLLVAKANELFVGSATDNACLSASTVTVNFGKESTDILDFCQTSGKASTLFSSREVTVDVEAYLTRHDISKWLAFKNNTTVQFMYNAGRKSAGNWVAGSVVNLFSPTAKVQGLTVAEADGVFKLNFTLACFADSGQDEFYMNFL